MKSDDVARRTDASRDFSERYTTMLGKREKRGRRQQMNLGRGQGEGTTFSPWTERDWVTSDGCSGEYLK
jgi:hypothetical protein